MPPAPDPSRLDADALFRAHAGFVTNFLARLGIPLRDLDDLVQDIFLVAHRRGGFVDDGRAKPTTWLAEIAYRVACSARRKQRRSREDSVEGGVDAMNDASSSTSSGSSPARAAENSEALARVQRALDTLDLDHRTVFVLFELEGESCAAIAEAFELPIGTVYSRLHAARKKFRSAHERLCAAPPAHASAAGIRGVLA